MQIQTRNAIQIASRSEVNQNPPWDLPDAGL